MTLWCNNAERYGMVAITLHWLVAVAIIFMLILGFYMTGLKRGSMEQFEYYQLHKSIGITILLLSIARLAWRLVNPVPFLPDTLRPWERRAARLAHYAFYALIVIIPLTGWVIVSASSLNIPTRLYGTVPWPHISFVAGLEHKKSVEEVFEEIHELLAFLTIGLLVVHIAAALRHHFWLKDNVLRRMLP